VLDILLEVGAVAQIETYTQKLFAVLQELLHERNSVASAEMKHRLTAVVSSFSEDAHLASLIICAVATLASHESKIKEIDWAVSGRQKQRKQEAQIDGMSSRSEVENSAKIDEVIETVLSAELAEGSEVTVLAARDLAYFLKSVFFSRSSNLKSLDKIITEDLFNE